MVERVLKLKNIRTQFKTEDLTNHIEYSNFLKTALAWKGSVTPKIILRVFWTGVYSIAIVWLVGLFPEFAMSITPFEYTGAVLGLTLVARVNSGMDRWWEARKIWGRVVNQSRNLAIIGYQYLSEKGARAQNFLNWVSAWPHAMRAQLRDERDPSVFVHLVGDAAAERIVSSQHMPMYIGFKISSLLKEMRTAGLDDFAFMRAERERALLIDAIGACERIRSTPIPFVLAIKTRRFIFLFLLLLPFALVEKIGWLTPFIAMLTAYPMFCLDEIGIQLQSPFAKDNLSHLPLNLICQNIENNIAVLPNYSEEICSDIQYPVSSEEPSVHSSALHQH